MCCRSEWQERMYIYKWHEVDQTKHEIFCVHIVCNEIQVKVNLEITTFFFYLRFPYCPNFFWFGVVCMYVYTHQVRKHQEDMQIPTREEVLTDQIPLSTSRNQVLVQSQCSCRFLVGSTGEPFKNRLLFHRLESQYRARSYVTEYVSCFVSLARPWQRQTQQTCSKCISAMQTDRSIGTQHTKAPWERSKSIKSHLLSSRSRSTPMPRTERSAQCRSIPNKPKQTINNGGCWVAIDVHGFANLHRHPNTANPTCSCLAAISNMAVQSFCRLVVHGNPAPSPWCKRFFLLAQQCFGATYEPLFLVRSWCFGCRKTKNRFETRLWLWTSTGTALVEKGYISTAVCHLYFSSLHKWL